MKPGDYIKHWECRWLVVTSVETPLGWAVTLWREGLPEPIGAFIEIPEARAALNFKSAGLLPEADYKGVLDRLRRTVRGETFRTATREEAGY